jgi:hypothetical protein
MAKGSRLMAKGLLCRGDWLEIAGFPLQQ